MLFTSWDINHVANLQFLRLLTLRTDETDAKLDGQDLALFMLVPEGACSGHEAHVTAHAVARLEDGIQLDGPGESFAGRSRVGARLMGRAD